MFKGMALMRLQAQRHALAGLSRPSHQYSPYKRPFPSALQHIAPPLTRLVATQEALKLETGHVEAASNEGLLFLDNIFPLKLYIFLGLPIKGMLNLNKFIPDVVQHLKAPSVAAAAPALVAQKSTPEDIPITFENVIPREEEGGVFLKFEYQAGHDLKQIEASVKRHLQANPIRPWFNPFRTASVSLVKGVPWLEDLRRAPCSVLKVEFVPPVAGQPAEELLEEDLYSLFRRYGKMKDIIPQPKDAKDLPKYAILEFDQVRDAIKAKACMHGYTVKSREGGGHTGTLLKLVYEHRKKSHFIWDWLVNHPRIAFPILAALIGTLAVAIFDPIRTFSIKAHISRSFSISDYRIFKWFMSQASKANELLSLRRNKTEDRGLSAIWDDRKDTIEQIRSWLLETADTFIVIQGPRGSGKKELLMNQALKGRRNTLLIDCKSIQEARGDSGTINAAASQVNYRPVFSWMNNISSMIDLAAQGIIGTKAGFSETLESQLQKIWQSTTSALREIALESRQKTDKDASLGDDEYLEAHPEKRPIVIIDNYHGSQETMMVYDKVAQFAANLTTTNTAHVIFLTEDVSYSKSLSKALPDRLFREVSLGDCSPDVAKRFVINHLDADANDESALDEDGSPRLPPSKRRKDLSQLDGCISTLGGRLTDLEYLARRIKSGEAPQKAVQEIIDQSASEILKMYIWDARRASPADGGKVRAWTAEQAWQLIKSLSVTGSMRYHEVLLNSTYRLGSEGEAVLHALEQAELIAIESSNGRPGSIKPGRPVYTAAFQRLTSDPVLSARLDLAIISQQLDTEGKGIAAAEEELRLLGQVPGGSSGNFPIEILPRAKYLLAKMHTGQHTLERLEKESARLKDVLKKEN